METKILVVLVLLCAVSIEALSLRKNFRQAQNVALKRDTAPEFQNFTQYRDHFNPQDKTTFQQRYVINDQYWDGTGPVFLMFGPESQLDPSTVIEEGNYIFVQWAKHFNALLLAIENRYYGESIPVPDYTLENLKWLTDEQILADTAVFRQYIAEQYNAHHNKWITFGGSYAGQLSGWMRIKYPNLIYASIASSAPVKAQDGNPQFMEVVTQVLEKLGSKECVENIATANRQVEHLLKTADGRAYLEEYYDTCSPIQTQRDADYFILEFAGAMMGVVQDLGVWPYITPAQVCAVMTNHSNDAFTNYRNLFRLFNGDNCDFVSYESYIPLLQATDLATALYTGRAYNYQMCYEFGTGQTSNSPNQPFGQHWNTLEDHHAGCYQDFGRNVSKADFQWTNTQYGGKHPGGSKILWVNGSFDPWHPLGVLHTPPGAEWDTLFIDGTSHVADMFVPTSIAPPTLAPAQAVIKHQLGKWIRE